MHKSILYLVVFVSGFVILGFETIGAKLFAPFIGTTVPVWAALMAVIIAASSTGYYLGGFVGRKVALPIVAGAAFSFSAGFVLVSGLWRGALLEALGGLSNYASAALLASACLFFVPTLLLSLSTVVVTRIAAASSARIGSAAGRLYAFATIGSVCGVFGMAYVLTPLFPLSDIMSGLAVAMLCASALSFLLIGNSPRTA